MSEKTGEFIGKSTTINLTNKMELTIKTPNLRFWFDFVFPQFTALQQKKLTPELTKQLTDEIAKTGSLSEEIIRQLPMPLLDLLLDVCIRFIGNGKDREWVKDNLQIVDFLNIINTLLELIDSKRVVDFFVRINRQMPIQMASLLTR